MINTAVEYMLDLNWTHDQLLEAIEILKEWDTQGDNVEKSFYKKFPNYMLKVDLAEREHLRNCIKFYKDKYENQ